MEKRQPPALSRVIFWEVDYDKIDWEKSAHYVIERALTYGNWSDWQEIKTFYGLEKIREVALHSCDLDRKTLNFLSKLFNIPSEQFRCFTYIQSNIGHWVY